MTTKNIFISHQHEDASQIQRVINLIEKKGNLNIRDSSIYKDKKPNNANNPEYIRSLIRPQIDWAGTVIVLIGEKTKDSDWVNYEINYAGKNDKKIIGVFLPGADDQSIPDTFKQHGSALCTLRSDSLNKAIIGTTNFDNPDGDNRTEPIGLSIKRYIC